MATVELMLGPGGVQLNGPGGRVMTSGCAVTASSTAAEVEAVLAGLLPAVAEHAGTPPRGGWPARVVLDDSLFWLDVVQGDFASQSERVLRALMQASAAEVFGDAVATQALRWQVQADGRHALLLAVPEVLVRSVEDALQRQHMVVERIEPAFVRAWNQAASHVELRDGVVAWLHAGQAILVRMRRGSMSALGREPQDDSPGALNQAMRRLLARHGDSVDEHTRRLVLAAVPVNPRSTPSWRVHRVELMRQGVAA
ncbi:MAG: hypothetical protein JNJ89_14235 [Rubrivivax sp.]|nr:hypothetical protein [Rubrivivax sp.]